MSDEGQQPLWEAMLDQEENFPDQKIKLHRPMKQWFRRWIKTDPDLNVTITMSQVIEAMFDFHTDTKLKKHLGASHAKNFENARRSKHKITPPTEKLLKGRLGHFTAFFPTTPLKDPEGPLTPEAHHSLSSFENFVTTSTNISKIRDRISCPYCHHDTYIPAADWWKLADLGIGHEASIVIDRLLLLNLAAHQIISALCELLDSFLLALNEHTPYQTIYGNDEIFKIWTNFFDGNRLPINHWLDTVRHFHGVENLSQLSKSLSSYLNANDQDISHPLLRKWASGQQLLAANTATKMTSHLDNHLILMTLYYLSRLNMLAFDLTLASTEQETDQNFALKLLSKRLHMLFQTNASIKKLQ